MASAIFSRSSFTFETVRQLVFCFDVLFNFIDMKGMRRFRGCQLFCFAIACWMWSTGLPSALGHSPVGFSEVHFEGTFVILGEQILDTSDLGVLLQETNPDFKNLSKSDGKDVSWDSDGVRYTADSKDLKITWVIDPAFLPYMNGHPTQPFKDKVSIFEIEIIRNKPVPTDLLPKYGFEALGDQVPIYYRLEINGWRINIITDRDRNPEAVTLQHSLSPD